jgi:hypothetical protein
MPRRSIPSAHSGTNEDRPLAGVAAASARHRAGGHYRRGVLRADWGQESETELRYREMLLAESDLLGISRNPGNAGSGIMSVGAERDDRIDVGRAARRNHAGDQRGANHNSYRSDERSRIVPTRSGAPIVSPPEIPTAPRSLRVRAMPGCRLSRSAVLHRLGITSDFNRAAA